MSTSTNRNYAAAFPCVHLERAMAGALVLMLATLAGCSSRYHPINNGTMRPAGFVNGVFQPEQMLPDIVDHVIVVDGQGVPRDPAAGDPNGPALCMDAYRRQIAHMLLAMRAFNKGRTEKKVLIFVHGGLNDPDNSLKAADQEIQPIMAAGYYPIFLNWDSGLDTYGEHIFRLTQGLTDDSNVRKLLFPFYILGDAGAALARAPVVWSTELGNDILAVGADLEAVGRPPDAVRTLEIKDADTERWAHRHRGEVLANAFKVLRCRQLEEKPSPDGSHKELQISIGPDLGVSGGRMAVRATSYVLTSPFKLVLSPVIDFIGTPSWQIMARRTLLAFDGQLGGNPGEPRLQPETRPAETRADRARKATNFDSTGALEVFREALFRTLSRSHPGPRPGDKDIPDYEVTLIAHSAGTLVLNEWLRHDMLEEKNQSYPNIVYLAAACSVRDFERAVIPYLLKHPESHFYNLMLHPLADLRETGETGDIPPRGSLPAWLDEFLTNPQTPLDRTLGRWDNIVPAVESIPKQVRGQITLKSFTLAPYDKWPPPGQPFYGPQVHGAFRGSRYWCSDFWTSESPIVP